MKPDRVSVRLIYEAGARSRGRGRTHLDNPHPVGSWEHDAWFCGWRGADIEAVALTTTGGGTP